jgi:hypothetical protein
LFSRFTHPLWWQDFGFIFGALPKDFRSHLTTDHKRRVIKFTRDETELECEYLTPKRVKECRIVHSDLTGVLELNQYECRA